MAMPLTPRPSLDGHQRDILLGNVTKFVSCPMNIAETLGNVLEVDFEWLKKKGEAGEIPGWERVRLVQLKVS
jgi:hypothetical protein